MAASLVTTSRRVLIETEPMDHHHHHRQPQSFGHPARMYPQITSDILSPPFSPTDAMEMPLVKELLARNEHTNLPDGTVLCVPCYLCKQPFNDIEAFKVHLTQHAADIHAQNTTRSQEEERPPMMKAVVPPMNQRFVHPIDKLHFHSIDQGAMDYHHYCNPYSPPLEPHMPFQMPVVHKHPIQPPPMHLTVQHTNYEPPLQFSGYRPVELSEKLPMSPHSPLMFPAQPMISDIPGKAHAPLEVENFCAPETMCRSVEEPTVLVNPPSQAPDPTLDAGALMSRSSVLTKPPNARPPAFNRGQFVCAWCGKKLSTRQSLRYHESHFHGEAEPAANRIEKDMSKQHKCSTCKKRYKRRTFLLMHMKVKHGIICLGRTAADPESPISVDSPASPEAPVPPKSSADETPKKEIWSTRIFNAVAAARYQPASERADKYLVAPRQQTEQLESGHTITSKRTYPLRSPFFNPDLWLDCDAYS
ncbi:uncharacterized protein LOC6543094 [Drosophila erecta]|uniref:C2H2-type domain-containing protein n=1 Tax=Drosophila erecta TaxID=7220 RepID=B3N6U5_DROER|nr:uncharacterized protein LOC6543094 [Drosophila erecta]EDV58194.1 uncharacterized protein Dere_GG24114 [Drosophila erecta]